MTKRIGLVVALAIAVLVGALARRHWLPLAHAQVTKAFKVFGSQLAEQASSPCETSTGMHCVYVDTSDNLHADNQALVYYVERQPSPQPSPGARVVRRTAVADVDYTAHASDYLIAYTALTAPRTATVPENATAGTTYVFKDESGVASIHNITIDAAGADTIDGAATVTITSNYGRRVIYSSGADWFVISQ